MSKQDDLTAAERAVWLEEGCSLLIERTNQTYHAIGDEFVQRVIAWRNREPLDRLASEGG